ncbi:MAG TPA: pitrilysin family protein [Bryobacteraceae bacterium]|nr:pitrilysin family protein [Bryobacteraceae bacterium]
MAVLTTTSPSPSQTRDIQKTVLPNGVRVITESMPHVRSISIGIWIGTGSRSETPPENGISHFVEHMVFKGTTHRSAEEIARSVDSIGGGLDAFTSKEMVSYNTKVLDEHLPIAFDVLSDLVLNPLFQEEDIAKEKSVILEEIKMEVDNPEYLIHEIFSSNFWKGHALGKPILGTKETVSGFQRETLFDYYHRIYSPANILITAAGHLEHELVVRLATEQFSGLEAKGKPPAETTPLANARLTFRNKNSLEQVHLYLGVPIYSLPHEMRYQCYALNTLLGGGMSSRLFQNIRERQGLAYAVFSELNMYRDTGCLSIYAGTSTESARKVVESVVKELRQLQQELVPPDELRRAKDHLKGSLMLSLESTSSRMANLARQELYFQRFISMDEMLESVEAVTAEAIRKIAQEFFSPEMMALAMLGRLDGFKMTRADFSR